MKVRRQHDEVPSPDIVRTRFPDLDLPRVRAKDMPLLLSNLRQRRKYIEFLTALNDAASAATSYEGVDDVIQNLQGRINSISFKHSASSHLVDLFTEQVRDRMVAELHARRSGRTVGMPTGLGKFDRIAGGLQKQKMITIIGRPGLGKSWLDLLFVATSVINGYKVILYPLEMTLAETAFRLYTLFTQQLFGAERVLKNYDLTTGKVTTRKLARFLMALEDKFAGQLMVADVASLADPYTCERIEAEVEAYKPDMFWVDYLTLLKPPNPGAGSDDWASVRALSSGIKNAAMRRDCVGGCSAQVNREAMRARVFLPRLEHIAYGDSIGQDADQVISLNRKGKTLYYALVKNRGGPEIGRTKATFDVDNGLIIEQEDEDDDADS
jgi:replicative DNA helicase